MTLQIVFDAATEAKLREQSEATGKPVEKIVREAVEEKIGLLPAAHHASPQQQADRWSCWVADMARLNQGHTVLVDDSRESIYADRGE
jgi:hypothetical protein